MLYGFFSVCGKSWNSRPPEICSIFHPLSSFGASINYVDKGEGPSKCHRYYISLFSKLVTEEGGGQKSSKFSQHSLWMLPCCIVNGLGLIVNRLHVGTIDRVAICIYFDVFNFTKYKRNWKKKILKVYAEKSI